MYAGADSCGTGRAEDWHLRDRFFLEAMWYSWRRSGELSAVRVRDVDLQAYPDSPHGR
jgi:hypothetical protein